MRKTTETSRTVGTVIGSSIVRIRTVHIWAEYRISVTF